MECNKDEAIRAKAIAERKLTEKDFAGAKKFASKAQALYPGLEGLSQMLTTLEVYISAENRISGEVDWYKVLGVSPTDDDETVKRQYRKLALMLHPDKNKSVGADGAFKLLSEAWSLLSDKAKRLAYNQRRSSNGFHNFPNRSSSSSNTKPPNTMSRANPTAVPRPSGQKTSTFWTVCRQCNMHYEYLRMYLNNTLICPRCKKPFLATEIAPPPNFKPPNSFPPQKYQKLPHHANVRHPGTAPNSGVGASGGLKSQRGSSFCRTGVGLTVSSPSVAAKAANVVQQANERIKRAHDETQGTGCWQGPLEKRRGLDGNLNGYVGNTAPQTGKGNRIYDSAGVKYVPRSIRELSALETRNMLISKAKTEIHKKLTQWSSETSSKAVDLNKDKASNVKQKSFVKGSTGKQDRNGVSDSTTGELQSKKASDNTLADADIGKEAINVPDPDFHDFDQERTESDFGENQVWAAYDDDDGMPRFYCMIHKVISLKPFKMRISWLNSKTNTEFSSEINWLGSGFYKSCGQFWIGKHELTKSLNSFSHKVKWSRGPMGGSVCILPKKGDMWALYRNWSPDWNEHTPDEVIHKYDVVEVLEDYNEDQGISIAPLVKVVGFRTVFHTCTDPGNVRRIPKEEMFRFSHQVPNHLLTGEEAKDAPKGCQELDPASTPFELLVTETSDKKIEVNEKEADVRMTKNGKGS